MANYDVIVIGAGPAGYVCAIRAAQLGLTTAIIDKQWLGGVCLNIGCIPSKALLKNADVVQTLRTRGKEFGFSIENLKVDYSVAVKRSRQVSDRLTKGVGFLMKKNKIDVHMGSAKFTARDTVEVTDSDGKTQYPPRKEHNHRNWCQRNRTSRMGSRWCTNSHIHRSHTSRAPAKIRSCDRFWSNWS